MTKTIPLAKPYFPRLEDIGDDIEAVFRSGRISNFGPLVRAFEGEVSERLQVEHCLAVSNASIGLLLLLETLPRGSEVIVPSFTFLPTLQAILWNGLRPVFADIDPNTFTLCPGSVRSVMNEDVSAIVTVNVFGVPGDIEELTRIADHNGCQLYFDSAHGIGTRHDGQLIGGSGAAEVFSLSATKLLPCGEGGLVCTNLERIATQIVDRRNYGFRKGEANSGNLGVNARITEISAALGLWGLNNLDDYLKKRHAVAEFYHRYLADVPGLRFQHIPGNTVSNHKDIAVLINEGEFGVSRDDLKSSLYAEGIETAPYFHPPLHKMDLMKRHKHRRCDLSTTDRISKDVLCLPIFHEIEEQEVEFVCDAVRNCRSQAL